MTIRIISFLLCYVLLTGCTSKEIPTTYITNTTDCNALSLKTGQTVVVTLPESKASGYRWKLKDNASPILQLIEHETKRVRGSRHVKNEAIWKFQVVQAGKSSLALDYQLEWDTEISNNQHFSCVIVANN